VSRWLIQDPIQVLKRSEQGLLRIPGANDQTLSTRTGSYGDIRELMFKQPDDTPQLVVADRFEKADANPMG